MYKIYYSLSDYLKKKYNEKVYKICVDGGFNCPNRDGSKGFDGCIYCNNKAFVNVNGVSIEEQVENAIGRLRKRGINKFILYFQSNSNTYGSLDHIKQVIEKALIDKNIIGIYIGTRPDTIDEEKLKYFSLLNHRYEIFLEYGLQSMHDSTLQYINRGHSLEILKKLFI
jgi:radical SAM protein (TIGR01212 family)